MSRHQVLQPPDWFRPVGYANGIAAAGGRPVFLAGQVGWDAEEQFHSLDLAPQFEQALRNILVVLAQAGGEPQHICRITAYCTDKAAYLAARPQLGAIWQRHLGRHYPAMSLVFVTELVESEAKIELEATAVVPEAR